VPPRAVAPVLDTLVDLLRHQAAMSEHLVAYTFLDADGREETAITFGDLDRRARVIASALQRAHLTGERALLFYPHTVEYVAALFGCFTAGVVAVPVAYPKLSGVHHNLLQIRGIVADARPAVVLTSADILADVRVTIDRVPELSHLQWIATDLLQPDAIELPPPDIRADMPAFLQYTSGSTRDPKGVTVSHANVLYNHRMLLAVQCPPPRTTLVSWLPLFHDMGLIGIVLMTVHHGGHCVLMSPATFLQRPLAWLQAVSRYQARTSGGPTFAYDLCVRKITPEQRAGLDLSPWQIAFHGAEPIRAAVLDGFYSAFRDCGFRRESFFLCYGLAEASVFVSGTPRDQVPVVLQVRKAALRDHRVETAAPGEPDTVALVSCGRTWLDQKIVVVDPDSRRACADDRVGEIWVAGPNVAQGYWNRPDETAATFDACRADTGEGPFLRTGDLGFMRGDQLFVSGRLKDLIVIDGSNHYPHDIEATVEQCHPAIRPQCSVAVSVDVDGRERLIVVAEVDRRYSPARPVPASDLGSVVTAVRAAIAAHHGITAHKVVLIRPATIPKTSSGKLRRARCRALYLDNGLDIWAIR
jgi:acyl-CoA synthetase (AMP-forming)/AMP-acid ligase II